MSVATEASPPRADFPRYFRIAGLTVNSYQALLCVAMYAGVLASAAAARSAGISPLRMGLLSVACAIAALPGARIYHLIVFSRHYSGPGGRARLWDGAAGGWSMFGGLLPAVGVSFLLAPLLAIPIPEVWDYMAAGVVAGGFWARLGCALNGCCGGRSTARWYGIRMHDTRGVSLRRIPVQFIEMGWWVLGAAVFLAFWQRALPAGSYALGVLGWYGFGRFWLDPLREKPDLVFGRIRVNQVVAVVLFVVAVLGLTLTVGSR